MSMTIVGISDAVQALLEGMTDPNFVQVNAAPESKDNQFSGYPSVNHFYRDTENNFATVSQNRRVIQHSVFIYLLFTGKTEDEKWRNAMGIVDKVIQKFDESSDLDNACDIMRPAPGQMSKEQLSGGEGLVIEITLYCEADVTFTNV